MTRMIAISAALMALYWVTVAFVPVGIVQASIHAVAFVAFAAVAVLYMPAAVYAMVERRQTKTDYFILGIVTTAIGGALTRAWSSAYLLLGKPLWMYQNPVFYSFVVVSIIGCMILVTAPGINPDGAIARKDWMIVAAIFALGFLIGSALTYLGIQSPLAP